LTQIWDVTLHVCLAEVGGEPLHAVEVVLAHMREFTVSTIAEAVPYFQ
jgi:hypothetical protein